MKLIQVVLLKNVIGCIERIQIVKKEYIPLFHQMIYVKNLTPSHFIKYIFYMLKHLSLIHICLFLAMAEGGRKIFVMGHPEYDRVTLDGEYKRDLAKGLPIEIPKNYYKDDDPNNKPLLTWRAHANNLYRCV